jgi:hypothetical protein
MKTSNTIAAIVPTAQKMPTINSALGCDLIGPPRSRERTIRFWEVAARRIVPLTYKTTLISARRHKLKTIPAIADVTDANVSNLSLMTDANLVSCLACESPL